MKAIVLVLCCLNISMFFTSIAFSQEAKLVKQGEWGSGRYESVVEIGGYYYVETSSNQIDVIDPKVTGKEALIKQINLDFDSYPNIISIGKFKNYLVVITDNYLTVYNIENITDLTVKFKISVNASWGENLVSQGNRIYYIDQKSRLFIIEEDLSTFDIVKVIQTEESDYENNKYINKRSLFVEDSIIYYIYTLQNDGAVSTQVVSFDVNEFTPLNSGELVDFGNSNNIYVGDGRFVLASYEHMYLVDIENNEVNILSDFNDTNYHNLTNLTFKDNILKAFSYGNRLLSFEISSSNSTSFLSDESLNSDFPANDYVVDAYWLDEKLIALSYYSGLFELEFDDSLVSNIKFTYNQSGYMGKGLIEKGKLFLPRRSRVDVVDISDVKYIYKERTIDENLSHFERMNDQIIASNNDSIFNFSLTDTGELELNSEVQEYFQGMLFNNDSTLFSITNNNNSYKIQRRSIDGRYTLYQSALSVDFPESMNSCPQKIRVVGDRLITFDPCSNKIHLFNDFKTNDFSYDKALVSTNDSWLSEVVGDFIYYVTSSGIEIQKINDKDELEQVSFIEDNLSFGWSIIKTKVIDDYLFVITSDFIYLMDISIPTTPKFISKSEVKEWELSNAELQLMDGYIVATIEDQGQVKLFSINKAPIANVDHLAFLEDEVKAPIIAFSDPELDVLTFTIKEEPNHGEISIDELGLVYSVDANFNGEDNVLIKAEDIYGNFIEQSIGITITAVNDAPVIGDNQFIAFEDERISEQLNVTDVDSETLIYELTSDTLHGNIVLTNSGEFTYTPQLHYFGQDEFSYKVEDEQGSSVEGQGKLTIAPVNDVPSLTNTMFITNEDTELIGKIEAIDIEEHSFQFELVENSIVNGNVTVGGDGGFVFNAYDDFNGVASFTIKVTDSELANAEYQVTINVTAVNDVPVVENSSANLNEGGSYTNSLPTHDIDGDPLLYQIITNVTNGSLTLHSNGEYTYIPDQAFSGIDSFEFEVTDGQNKRQAKISLTIQKKPNPEEKSESSGGSMAYMVLLMLFVAARFRFLKYLD